MEGREGQFQENFSIKAHGNTKNIASGLGWVGKEIGVRGWEKIRYHGRRVTWDLKAMLKNLGCIV